MVATMSRLNEEMEDLLGLSFDPEEILKLDPQAYGRLTIVEQVNKAIEAIQLIKPKLIVVDALGAGEAFYELLAEKLNNLEYLTGYKAILHKVYPTRCNDYGFRNI